MRCTGAARGLRFVEFGKTGSTSYAATYGDETLLGSVWRVLCSEQLIAVVHYGEAQKRTGATAALVAEDLHNARTQSMRQS